MTHESNNSMTDEKPDRTPYTGRFVPSGRGHSWIGTPTCDLARYLGCTESNLIISLEKARPGKPDADLLYCEAPDGLSGARRSRGVRKTLLVSRGLIKWFITVARVDKGALEAVAAAFASEFKRRRTEQPDDALSADQAKEESTHVEPEAVCKGVTLDVTPLVFEKTEFRTGMLRGHPCVAAEDIVVNNDSVWNGLASIEHVPEKHRGLALIRTAGGIQEAWCLVREGVYHYLMRSDSSRAKPLQEFICEKVLPEIQDTGSYNGLTDDDILARSVLIAQQRIAASERVIGEQRIEIAGLNEAIMRRDNEVAVLLPKATSNDRLAKSYGLINVTETAKMLQTPRKFFVQFLLETKQSYRSGRTYEADSDLIGHAAHCEGGTGRLTHRPFTYQDKHGETITKSQMLITPKGLAVFGHEYRLWYVRTYPFNPPPPPIQPDMLNPRPN